MPRHSFTATNKGALVAVAGVLAVAAGAGVMATADAAEPRAAKGSVPRLVVATVFAPVSAAPYAQAVTYDSELVPVGGRVQVEETLRRDGGTRIELRVKDLAADRVYGAHVHTKPCGKLPADAGPHYQDRLDPTQPSVDPEYANPDNEAWLDLTADKHGSARSLATVDWRFRERGARSVVLHEMATATHEGHAGTAGARLACMNVPFV
ncbi:superoxide dismutase family protein [Streptomyces sp. KM273126]|uniref:superoxide dismutase family protein n=1 Tax=Streptomyces sp. KM273126 TaxID=2545247 RepID=UPI001038CA8D|nr:superoxide dismutase family protein [Streptomyces sp. KM273126]MBA2807415.1 superoxide dismutase family protein [Streptomyces sp. KM273126]